MADEGSRSIDLQVWGDRADEPSMAGEGSRLMAAEIASKLRAAGLGCEIVNFVPTPTAVLRHDRNVVVLALTLLTALAWSYLLWVSADMGGMDMGDFRMLPSGMGLMVPAHTPWLAMEFGYVFVMWTVMMVGMMTPSAAPMILMYAGMGRRAEPKGRPLSNCLLCCRLLAYLGRFLAARHAGAMGT